MEWDVGCGRRHCGDEFVGTHKFCIALNMTMICNKTYYNIAREVELSGIDKNGGN